MKLKKIVAWLVVGCLTIGCNATVSAKKVSYKSTLKKVVKTRTSALNYMEDYDYLEMFFGKITFDSYYFYDLDQNGIQELFVYSKNMGLTQVFTYVNNEVVDLGYYHIYGINKKKKEIIVKGHWHGAGGSGMNEWSAYKIGTDKDKIVLTMYIDKMEDDTQSVYCMWNPKTDNYLSGPEYKQMFSKLYKKHIKGTVKIKKFKKKKIA